MSYFCFPGRTATLGHLSLSVDLVPVCCSACTDQCCLADLSADFHCALTLDCFILSHPSLTFTLLITVLLNVFLSLTLMNPNNLKVTCSQVFCTSGSILALMNARHAPQGLFMFAFTNSNSKQHTVI